MDMRTDDKLKTPSPGENAESIEVQEKIATTPPFQRQPTSWIGRKRGTVGRFQLSPINRRRWETSRPTGAAIGASGSFSCSSC